jgi:hypothetical protein
MHVWSNPNLLIIIRQLKFYKRGTYNGSSYNAARE